MRPETEAGGAPRKGHGVSGIGDHINGVSCVFHLVLPMGLGRERRDCFSTALCGWYSRMLHISTSIDRILLFPDMGEVVADAFVQDPKMRLPPLASWAELG